jgi:hypothetical protein
MEVPHLRTIFIPIVSEDIDKIYMDQYEIEGPLSYQHLCIDVFDYSLIIKDYIKNHMGALFSFFQSSSTIDYIFVVLKIDNQDVISLFNDDIEKEHLPIVVQNIQKSLLNSLFRFSKESFTYTSILSCEAKWILNYDKFYDYDDYESNFYDTIEKDLEKLKEVIDNYKCTESSICNIFRLNFNEILEYNYHEISILIKIIRNHFIDILRDGLIKSFEEKSVEFILIEIMINNKTFLDHFELERLSKNFPRELVNIQKKYLSNFFRIYRKDLENDSVNISKFGLSKVLCINFELSKYTTDERSISRANAENKTLNDSRHVFISNYKQVAMPEQKEIIKYYDDISNKKKPVDYSDMSDMLEYEELDDEEELDDAE